MERHKPATGVLISQSEPTIVFLTVCTEGRMPWLIEPGVHELLVESWTEADAWLVGFYLLMPDHLHLFCAPRDLGIPLERWVSYWKRLFTIKARNPGWKWQAHKWDTRLRRSESYREKWDYRASESSAQRIGRKLGRVAASGNVECAEMVKLGI